MKCPFCSHRDSRVVDSRSVEDGSSIRRRRECMKCTKRFTTYEQIESVPLIVIKKDGKREVFNRQKLINGIYYNHTLPNGQTMTYYMNGLRALIAQFKVAPYLPIENQHINDVLGIEAVSLVNLTVNTVEGFPRLLQATLTLRDFNYRIFMPDVPFDYNSTTDEDGNIVYEPTQEQISQMNPIFAKCFHWEIFRYYYQRAIAQGSKLAQFTYNTLEYAEQYYKSRNALKPVNWCDKSDTISFYVPDENWLSVALSIKKERDYYGQNPITIEPTDKGKDFIESVGGCSKYLTVNGTYARRLTQNCKISLLDYTPGDGVVKRENVLDDNSMVYYDGSNNMAPADEDLSKNKTIQVAGGDLSGSRQPNVKVDIGFGNRQYFLAPHYPMNPAALCLGLSWNFYN